MIYKNQISLASTRQRNHSQNLTLIIRHLIGMFMILIFGREIAFAQISDPTDIPGLVLWTDGMDINGNGVQPANGSLVTLWADKSGNGNDLTATTALAPTFEATGFDGVNPGLRFPNPRKMSANSPFSNTFDDTVTVFFVNANVTATNNFSVNLNGDNKSSNGANGRFSFHTPWGSSRIYFDGGACCGSTRLSGVYPNGLTETTLITGVNDAPGARQLLRIDGAAFQSDSTGFNARMDGGVRIGATSGNPYNGRFAEVVIYEDALTQSQIEDVECYLLSKWKPSALPSYCSVPPQISASKTVQVYDPASEGLYAIPGNDLIYTLRFEHISGSDVDNDTALVIDTLPNEVVFYNGDIDDAGPQTNPVSFTESGSGLTFDYATDVGYSSSTTRPTTFADCNYPPISGYDPAVKHICILPTGTFSGGTPNPYFDVSFRVRLE